MERFSYFVMLAGMRTGSNLLENNLNCLDDVVCHGELFNPHFIGYPTADGAFGFTAETRDDDPQLLLKAVRKSQGLNGFRLFPDHSDDILDAVLSDPRCAKIVLSRDPLESYVSRKIATATGQWMMRDASKRKAATAVFDKVEFEEHLNQVAAFQDRIRSTLQKTGQTAFYVDYGQLKDADILNGLFAWLGTDGRIEQINEAIKKQNAKPLSDLVENFEEMTTALAQLDGFGAHRVPFHEPRRTPAVQTLVAAVTSPLLFMPIQGDATQRVEGWLAQVDGVRGNELRRKFTRKSLDAWFAEFPMRRTFAVLSHPVARAHFAFREKILNTGPGSYRGIRRALIKRYEFALPDDDAILQDPDSYKPLFKRFLEVLELNLAGQTAIRVDGFWASQGAILRGMSELVYPDVLIRYDRLEEGLSRLAGDIGIAEPPRLEDVGSPHDTALEQIYDDDIEQAARRAYHRDYLEFGFGDWR